MLTLLLFLSVVHVVCVSDARRHQPVCKDVKDCMAHAHCGITQLHLALCCAIEDAMAVVAMNAAGADIIDVSVHHRSSASLLSISQSERVTDEDNIDVKAGNDASSVASSADDSTSESGIESDRDVECEEEEDKDKADSVDSDEHVLKSVASSSSVLLRGFEGSRSAAEPSQAGAVGDGDSVSVLTGAHDWDSVPNRATEQVRSTNSSIASQPDIDLPLPSAKTSSAPLVKEGIASKKTSGVINVVKPISQQMVMCFMY
jgi:hypothetical protein